VEPKPRKGFSSKAVDLLENLVVKLFYDSSLCHHWIAGNFAPVKDETPPTKDLPVKGHLPVSDIYKVSQLKSRFLDVQIYIVESLSVFIVSLFF